MITIISYIYNLQNIMINCHTAIYDILKSLLIHIILTVSINNCNKTKSNTLLFIVILTYLSKVKTIYI